jgi:1-acyl-sn-glycerol-3-phosphate acyltransferase
VYGRFLAIVYRASAKARRHRYTNEEWCQSGLKTAQALEHVGVSIEITGIEHIERLDTPCVVIANHMSVLETAVLPAIIQPLRDVTYVVKQSLLEYPVWKHIMRSRDPVAVTRTDPRGDLKAVLEGGAERLERGVSIIVFPQTTRTHVFDPDQFSSIGIKLARKAGVPVVPLALVTDAWGNGKLLKDFGSIDASKPVRFAFGEPIRIEGRGKEEHEAVIEFIAGKLAAWRPGDAQL